MIHIGGELEIRCHDSHWRRAWNQMSRFTLEESLESDVMIHIGGELEIRCHDSHWRRAWNQMS